MQLYGQGEVFAMIPAMPQETIPMLFIINHV